MKQNYQKQMDAVVASLPRGERPRLLLHSCCGPCSSYVLEALTPYFRVTVLYYNPNIQPREEYDLRLENQRKIIAALPTPSAVEILECGYDPNCREDEWDNHDPLLVDVLDSKRRALFMEFLAKPRQPIS